MTIKNTLVSLDLFQIPFSFLIGNSRSKRTLIGGVLSFIILATSIIYCYYLLNLYFSNQVQAKITQVNSIKPSNQQIPMKEDFIYFEFIVNGVTLKQYEKKVGKTFLNYQIYYIINHFDGTQDQIIFSSTQCTDSNFTDYQCISESEMKDKEIYYKPIEKEFGFFGLAIFPCDPSTQNNCATQEEFFNLFYTQGNYLQIFVKIEQYNPETLEYEIGYKQEFFYFDPSFYFVSKFSLIKATTSITKGMIVQSTEKKDTIYDYLKSDSQYSLDFAKELNFEDLVWIIFEIDQTCSMIFVQYPMITEILAQVMSIFNSLIILGVVAKSFGQSQIVYDMNNLLLKQYYKKTLVSLQANEEGRKVQNQFQIGISSKQIIDLQKQINKMDFQSLKQIFKVNLFSNLKIFFINLFKIKKLENKNKSLESENFELISKKLSNYTKSEMNIFSLYKDILQIKMAIKLILTKEQFAALQFCGTEILTKDLFQKEENKPTGYFIEKEDIKNEFQSPNQQELDFSPHIVKSDFINNFSFDNLNEKTSQIDVQDIQKQSPIQQDKQIHYEIKSQVYENQSTQGKQTIETKKSKSIFMKPSFNHFNKQYQKESFVFTPTSNEGDIEENNCEISQNLKNVEINYQYNLNTKGNQQISASSIQKDHLLEMDFIEKSEETQAFFLERFLQQNIQKQRKKQVSVLDMNIFQSLLINNFYHHGEEKEVNNQELYSKECNVGSVQLT